MLLLSVICSPGPEVLQSIEGRTPAFNGFPDAGSIPADAESILIVPEAACRVTGLRLPAMQEGRAGVSAPLQGWSKLQVIAYAQVYGIPFFIRNPLISQSERDIMFTKNDYYVGKILQ